MEFNGLCCSRKLCLKLIFIINVVVLFDARYTGIWREECQADKMGSLTSRRSERQIKCFAVVHD